MTESLMNTPQDAPFTPRTELGKRLAALHVAAALDLAAEEIVTTEGPFKPMFRVPGIWFATLGR